MAGNRFCDAATIFAMIEVTMRGRRLFIFLLSAVISMAASALERPFPPNIKRGSMTPAPYPEIVIDGKSRTLSAGARIWNQDNMIEMPASLRGSLLPVYYTENLEGDIDRVWILTREEQSRPNPK